MNKLITTFLLLLVPGFVFADSLSFTPPPSDYSVVFLGNLFGVVDGVLSGTGSQIMGSMFAVFNAAILAIGGIIIIYTLIVATMNTAHEGQMLGQKWSSIWIPIRTVLGLALLIPKASGYCLMQIFVMWIVLQGVGAADKVWNAALSYLNRGGVIIQAQKINPTDKLTKPNAGLGEIIAGARKILPAQVCMLGLQTTLEKQRKRLQDRQECKNIQQGSATGNFCNTPVPDFLSSVQPVAFQSASPESSGWELQMPHFEGGPYAFLNGICGTLRWNAISTLAPTTSNAKIPKGLGPSGPTPTFGPGPSVDGSGSSPSMPQLSSSEIQTIQISRAVAIQEMYLNLSLVARAIIGNDPQLSNPLNTNNQPATPMAKIQFGVPYTENGNPCTNSGECVTWGPAPGASSSGVLFNGAELINAINSYNGVMMPVVNLYRMMSSSKDEIAATDFINKASTQGWIMAGSYFFNLIAIQGSATEHADQTDRDIGLLKSTFDPSILTTPFQQGNCVPGGLPGHDLTSLCYWFDRKNDELVKIQNLIAPTPPIEEGTIVTALSASSTVNGFLNNGFSITPPGQPGTQKLQFADTLNMTMDPSPFMLPTMNFPCGGISLGKWNLVCLGRVLGDIFYNGLLVPFYNLFMQTIGKIILQFAMSLVMIPITGMAAIFRQGLDIISAPGVNPVVALANMGNFYINFAGDLWIMFLVMVISPLSLLIMPVMMLGFPFLIAGLGIMVLVGFTTAYFVPILPYMIFTFGAIAWLMAVVESMVAAPIVALGITHPEGNDAFGKGEHAILILLNVFLRPSMMIIGYIAGIAMTYVGVWILNAGFDQAISFIQAPRNDSDSGSMQASNWDYNMLRQNFWDDVKRDSKIPNAPGGGGSSGYTAWTEMFAYFFSILTYTSMYLVIVQKSFELISVLPDKVLRWIGGPQEGMGGESARWGEEVKGQQKEAGGKSSEALNQMGGPKGQLAGYAGKAVGMGLDKAGGKGSSSEGGVEASASEAGGAEGAAGAAASAS